MPEGFPQEFRRDVVAVAREGGASIASVAKDFGISQSCLNRWLRMVDVDDGVRPGVSTPGAEQLRELNKRNRLLEQGCEILRRAAAFFARESLPQ